MSTEAATLARMTPPTRWLRDHGISPLQLARALGVSAAQISHWCRGFRPYPPEFPAAVELALGYHAALEFEALLEGVRK